MLASTVKLRPRNLLIVFALAGDSTITRLLEFEVFEFSRDDLLGHKYKDCRAVKLVNLGYLCLLIAHCRPQRDPKT